MPIPFLKIISGHLATSHRTSVTLACIHRHFRRRDETILGPQNMVRFLRNLAARLKFGGFHMLQPDEMFCRPPTWSAFLHHLAASL
jgi:hypothetical protein